MDLPSIPPTCPDENVLSSFVEGNLGPDQASLIEAHVDGCERCHDVLAIYGRAFPRSRSGESTQSSGVRSGQASGVSHGRLVDRLQRIRPLPPGKLIGRYVILEWLGEGGASVVYTAYDPKLDRKVGLKLLRPQVSANEPVLQANLEAEARAMAKLAHPNVVAVHDVGTFEGQVFIAMEFVPGGTLRKWLRDSSRSVPQIVRAFVEAGRGLAAAHAAGLVHRDFKPENVLLGPDEHPKVTDFGLALAQDAEPAVAAGTPWYMAPEQQRGDAPDARSDQYSFCVALRDALESVSRRASVPPRIRRVLERGLSEAPEARYPSMVALLADLTTDLSVRWKGAAVLALGVVLSIGSVAYAYRQNRQSERLVCSGAESRLVGAWDAARQDAISRAFLAVDKPFAADAWRGTKSRLDAYAESWKGMHKDACEATRVRGEQSAELLDRRMLCLDERLKELRALTDVFVRADAVVVEKAVSAAGSLPLVARCGEIKVVMSEGRLPADPAIAARVAELRGRLAQATAMAQAGKYKEALPLAVQAADDARATGDRRVTGEALFRLGTTQGVVGNLPAATKALYEAERFADAAGDDRTRVLITGKLLFYAANQQANVDLIPILEDQARAALERLGGDDEAEAEFLMGLGPALHTKGRFADAEVVNEQALALWRKVERPEGPRVARNLINVGVTLMALRRLDEALAQFERSLAIEETVLGSSHPDLAWASCNIANIYYEQLDFPHAKEWFERSVSVGERAVGPAHPSLALCLTGLGEALRELGQYRAAMEDLQRARTMSEMVLRPDHPNLFWCLRGLGETSLSLNDYGQAIAYLENALTLSPPNREADVAQADFALGRALAGARRDRARARQLVIRARDALEGHEAKTPYEDRKLAEVRGWLAEHP